MNWTEKIKELLGRFWSVAFTGQSLIKGVKSVHATLGNVLKESHDRWRAGLVCDDDGLYADTLPFPVYLVVSRVERTGDTAKLVSGIESPAASIADILNGSAEVGETLPLGGWTMKLLLETPEPSQLTDHVLDHTVAMFNGPDFEWFGSYVLFHVDPRLFGLPRVQQLDADGNLCTCYKLFGRTSARKAVADMVAAFESPLLASPGGYAWDMHQNGATHYNTKQLLAEVAGCVVCREDGVVKRVWGEQDLLCIRVNDKAYKAPVGVQANFKAGDTVRKGDLLFGDMLMLAGRDIPEEGISKDLVPGALVMTDAGRVQIRNTELSASYTSDNVPLMPLDSSVNWTAYAKRCDELEKTPAAGHVKLQTKFNPFTFLMKTLRKGRSLLISMTVSDVPKVSAALACLRRCALASSLISVYLRADGDPVSVNIDSSSVIGGGGAVTEIASLNLLKMSAEATTRK